MSINNEDWLKGFHEGRDFGHTLGYQEGKREITWKFWWSLGQLIVFYGTLWYICHHYTIVVHQ